MWNLRPLLKPMYGYKKSENHKMRLLKSGGLPFSILVKFSHPSPIKCRIFPSSCSSTCEDCHNPSNNVGFIWLLFIVANAAAALSVTKLGAQPSAHSRQEIDSFLVEQLALLT